MSSKGKKCNGSPNVILMHHITLYEKDILMESLNAKVWNWGEGQVFFPLNLAVTAVKVINHHLFNDHLFSCLVVRQKPKYRLLTFLSTLSALIDETHFAGATTEAIAGLSVILGSYTV